MKIVRLFAATAALAGCGIIAASYTPPAAAEAAYETSAGRIAVKRLADGLDVPWAVAPLPNGGALVTEKDGRLLHFSPAWERQEVSGLPPISTGGQGGLLDVTLAQDFAETRTLFLSFSEDADGGRRTAAVSARLSADGGSLQEVRPIFAQEPALSGGRHFGSRIVETADGMLFITTGDRGNADLAQELDGHVGKVIRVTRDGAVPGDNPFREQGGALPEIWSYGHRNIQGAALDEQGRLWTLSHGARGGDEINLAEPGLNYGWPVISYGTHYSGAKIGRGTAQAGMEQPKWYWDPSIAPSGLMIYSGRLFPDCEGDLFAGALKFDYISRLERGGAAGDAIESEEKLFEGVYQRVRDIVEAPDGSIWFLAVGEGALFRIAPAESG
ncbi:MAG: PQQ-dependent sugar dehydrogenase [Pseudomonadota bacterium]